MHSATTSLRAPVGARAGAATNLTARARWGGDGEPAAPRGEREPAAPRARVPHHRRRANTRAAAGGGDGELAKRVKAATAWVAAYRARGGEDHLATREEGTTAAESDAEVETRVAAAAAWVAAHRTAESDANAETRVVQAAAWIEAHRAPKPPSLGPLGKLKAFFLTPDGKLNTQKLASAGASTVLSYGFVSNVNAFTLLMIAWYSFVTSTGLSPMAPGQWPKYLVLYGTLYATVGNLLRPARIALAATLAPVFERVVTWFQKRFNLGRPWAFAATVFAVNVCGTFTYMGLGVLGLSALLGKPLLG